MTRSHIGVETLKAIQEDDLVQAAIRDTVTQLPPIAIPGMPVNRAIPFAFDAVGLSDSTVHAAVLVVSPPPVLPLVVVAGVNDTFVYTPAATGTPETFTVAPGTYNDVAECATAMGAAIGGAADAFSTKATCADSGGVVLVVAVTAGQAHQGDTLTAGITDVLADLGFAPPSVFDGAAIPGVALFTPAAGDILMNAWIEVVTAWDGTTPFGNIGLFGGSLTQGAYIGISVPDMTVVDAVVNSGLLASSNLSLAAAVTTRDVPAKFVSTDPLRVIVSTDGSATGADPGATHGRAILHVVTVTPT